jgi:hypothetical protein
MNNKKTIWLLVIGAVIIVAAIALFLSGKKGINNLNTNTGEVNSETAAENVTPQSVVPVPETIDWKKEAGSDFKVEFMNDEEKSAMGIGAETRVQVLARDKETGVVLAYKVINADADIINSLEQ